MKLFRSVPQIFDARTLTATSPASGRGVSAFSSLRALGAQYRAANIDGTPHSRNWFIIEYSSISSRIEVSLHRRPRRSRPKGGGEAIAEEGRDTDRDALVRSLRNRPRENQGRGRDAPRAGPRGRRGGCRSREGGQEHSHRREGLHPSPRAVLRVRTLPKTRASDVPGGP